MLYLEMSRDGLHGGGSWSFRNCIWAPTRKKNGARSPYWEKVREVLQGDTILHLRGTPPQANFVGFSQVSTDGIETILRPPQPADWGYSKTFYRADLNEFEAFQRPINLNEVFEKRRAELEAYYDRNRKRDSEKRTIFYVKQSGKLQCQNGAYLSEVDEELLEILIGDSDTPAPERRRPPASTVETVTQYRAIQSRIGHSKFADQVKKNYGGRCCFPGCTVSDRRFLVASHIARWADNEALRGHTGNGLCFCLMHDKAFEVGLFTIDQEFKIFVSPVEHQPDLPTALEIGKYNGRRIDLGVIKPLDAALREHWRRVKLNPANR